MRKLFSLFLNEMLKIRKKVSLLVLVIIMTVCIIGCSVIFKVVEAINEYVTTNNSEWIESNIEDEASYREQIDLLEATADNEDVHYYEELSWLKQNWHYSYLYGTYSKENNIEQVSFRYDILELMVKNYNRMISEEYFTEQGISSPYYISTKAEYDKLDNIIKTGSYKDFIEYDNQRITESDISDIQKKYQIEKNNALYQICPTGEFETMVEKREANNLISQKSELKILLESDYDVQTNGNITDEKRKEIELSLAVVDEKIENAILTVSPSEEIHGYSFSLSFGVGSLFVVVILIIIAGAMMSGETSTGTIKSLIIAPVKRWKIYTAKYLALVVTIVVLTLYVYIVSVLINGLLFGFSSYGYEVYIVSGNVISIHYFTAQLAYAVCSIITLLVVVTLAYMLSVVTKNTATAVSITMGIYLGGGTIHTLLMSFLSNRPYLTKFLPFNNIEWFDLIFKDINNGTDIMDMMGNTLFVSPSSFTFAAIYVLVLLVCMFWTGLDSFCKKDIK